MQTPRARIINSSCDYQTEQKHDQLTQLAYCRGEVQKFGEQGPSISSALLPLGDRKKCIFSPADFNAVNNSAPLFKSNQRFCLLISSSEDVYVAVFAMFQHKGKVKISSLFPENNQESLIIKSGKIPSLSPLASQTMEGENLSHEAFYILASREPLLGSSILNNSAGFSSKQTVESSVSISKFDKGLGKLELNRVSITVLPYAISQSQ